MKLIGVVSERLDYHDIFIKYTYSCNIFVRYIHKRYTLYKYILIFNLGMKNLQVVKLSIKFYFLINNNYHKI